MRSRKRYDAVATVGTYKDASGQERKRYANVGTVFENEDGRLSLKLDTVPVGPGWSGYIQFFDPKPRDSQHGDRQHPPAEPSAPPPAADPDEIPF